MTWSVYTGADWGYPSSDRCVALAIDSSGAVWVALKEHAIVRYADGEWTRHSFTSWYEQLGARSDPRDMAAGPDGSVWIASEAGLVRIKDGEWTYYRTSNSDINLSEVSSVGVDTAGGIWVGGLEGVAAFDGRFWTFRSRESISAYVGNQISSLYDIHIDRTGCLYVGSNSGALTTTDRTMPLTTMPDTSRYRVHTVTTTPGGRIWYGGVSSRANVLYTQERPGRVGPSVFADSSGLPDFTISSLSLESDSILWIATVGGGVARFDTRTLFAIATIDQDVVSGGISIVPHPIGARSRIEFDAATSGTHRVDIVSSLGEHVTTLYNDNTETGRVVIDVDVADLASGGYLLTVRDPSRVRVVPLRVAH